MPTAPDLRDRMKFWLFLNVLQNSWNLQELLESPQETCMWNLRQFGEVTIFDGKMPRAPNHKNRMKFWLFSMFSKIHEIYRIYWNHHQKHACEIWGSSEKLQFLTEKCLQPRTLKTGWSFDFSQCSQKFMKFTEFIGITTTNMHVKFEAVQRSYNFWQKNAYSANLQNRMKFWLFLNVLQNSWNLQEFLESPPETCMWNLRHFGEVTIFDGKMPTAPDLQNRMKFWLFSMFSKIHEIYRIYWNHHQKHACEIWGSSEKLQFLTEKCLQRRTYKTGWNFDIHSMFSKIHETYRIYWNHHQKHACEIWGSSEKLQFLTVKCLQSQPSKQD